MVALTKNVTFAASIVLATLALSMVSTTADAGEVASIEAEAESGCENCGDIIMLEEFSSPKHKWVEMNDPVMGGKSTGTFSVDTTQHLGVFSGSVEIVSFLNAPGFIKAETTKGESWPDVSSCDGFEFSLRSSTPSYEGFRVSFGKKRPPDSMPYTYGFKANMALDADVDASSSKSSDGFQTVKLPFDEFTDKWDAGTGDAVVTCAENKEYCPDEDSLKDLFSIAVWGEGVEGAVDLEIRSVSAYGCSGSSDSRSDSDSDSSSSDSESEDSSDDEPEADAAITVGDSIVIEDFSNPLRDWKTMNDPVMGGKSKSSLTIGDGMARFAGTCAIVPFLRAPGFITMTTGVHVKPGPRIFGGGESGGGLTFPDVSSCAGLALTMRTTVEYEGYYVSFGTDKAPHGRYAMGYKAPIDIDVDDSFQELRLPFSTFSDRWDDATGKTVVTCSEDPEFCPSLDNLRDMKTISFWGEGVEGTVDLEIQYIGAYGCASGSDSGSNLATSSLVSSSSESSSSVSSLSSMMMIVASAFVCVQLLRSFRNRNQRTQVPRSSRAGYEEVDVVGLEATIV